METPKYNPDDLTADIVLKHLSIMNAEIIKDITMIVQTAFEDGYCRGHSAGLEWWDAVDKDIAYIESFNGVQGVDTLNEDLAGSAYGDIPNITDIELYHKMRGKKDEE